MATVTELINYVSYNLDKTVGDSESSTTFFTRAMVVAWLNAGLLQAVKDIDPKLLTTLQEYASGTGLEVALPAGFYYPVALTLGTEKAKIITPDDHLLEVVKPNAAVDSYGVLWDQKIDFFPSASYSYQLWYIEKPTALSTGDLSASPEIPEQYHYAIGDYATFLAMRSDKVLAQEYLQLYQNAVKGGAS